MLRRSIYNYMQIPYTVKCCVCNSICSGKTTIEPINRINELEKEIDNLRNVIDELQKTIDANNNKIQLHKKIIDECKYLKRPLYVRIFTNACCIIVIGYATLFIGTTFLTIYGMYTGKIVDCAYPENKK